MRKRAATLLARWREERVTQRTPHLLTGRHRGVNARISGGARRARKEAAKKETWRITRTARCARALCPHYRSRIRNRSPLPARSPCRTAAYTRARIIDVRFSLRDIRATRVANIAATPRQQLLTRRMHSPGAS